MVYINHIGDRNEDIGIQMTRRSSDSFRVGLTLENKRASRFRVVDEKLNCRRSVLRKIVNDKAVRKTKTGKVGEKARGYGIIGRKRSIVRRGNNNYYCRDQTGLLL